MTQSPYTPGPARYTGQSISNRNQFRRTAQSVEPLGTPTVARQLTAGATSASVTLTDNVCRISIRAASGDARFLVGTGTLTASATTSHFISAGERLDIGVPYGATLAYIRAGSSDTALEVTELV